MKAPPKKPDTVAVLILVHKRMREWISRGDHPYFNNIVQCFDSRTLKDCGSSPACCVLADTIGSSVYGVDNWCDEHNPKEILAAVDKVIVIASRERTGS